MQKRLDKQVIDCDLLVVGGGLAGCMAAIKGADIGLNTVLVEKANPKRSGAATTGVDHIWAYFPEVQGPKGQTIDDLVENHSSKVDNMIHHDLLYVIARNAYDRIHDLEKMGIKIRYSDSEFPGGFRLVRQFQKYVNTLNFDGRDMKVKMTAEVKKRGAKIISRVMMTDLIVRDGRVVGAFGVGVRDAKLYVFNAKAVILSTARLTGGRMFEQPGPGAGVAFNLRWPPSGTGDGKAMALRAGAELINMEFTNGCASFKNFLRGGGQPHNTYSPPGQGINAFGDAILPPKGGDIFKDEDSTTMVVGKPLFAEIAKGRGPVYCDLTTGTEEEIQYAEWSLEHEGGGYGLKHVMKRQGIDFRKHKLEMCPGEIELGNLSAAGIYCDGNCESTIKGLFAAGDEIGGVPFGCAPGAIATGWYAAEKADDYIRENKVSSDVNGSEEEIDQLEKHCVEILERKEGHRWQDAQITLNRLMNYYGANNKTEKMINKGLESLDDLMKNVELKAGNPHELIRCIEMRSLFLNSETILLANRERKESRTMLGMTIHTRLDYPKQDDENFKCSLSQRRSPDGSVVFAKREFRK